MSSPPSHSVLDDEPLILTLLAVAALPLALGYAALTWASTSKWLVARHVLVPAREQPLLSLPGGVGLDLSRLLVAAAAVAAVGILAGSVLRRRTPAVGELR